MKLYIIGLIFVLFLFYLLLIKYNRETYTDTSIDILSIKTDNKILVVLRKMLKDIDGLFRTHKITYWMDGGTLLGAVRSGGIIPWDDDGDLCIDYKDESKLLNLKNILINMGYGLVKFWGGYKIYPLNGINIKYYNRNWHWNKVNKELEDKEVFNYKYPFIDIFLCKKFGDKYHYANKYVKRIYSKYYHNNNDLFPLKRYYFDGFYLTGPNNPKPYLDQAYGKDWRTIGYKAYDHMHMRFIPLVKFKIK